MTDPSNGITTSHRTSQLASHEWSSTLRHLKFGIGFSLIVILALEQETVENCKRSISEDIPTLSAIHVFKAIYPDDLYKIPNQISKLRISENQGCVWIDCLNKNNTSLQGAWNDGMRYLVARLNERRDRLVEQCQVPIILCGPPQLMEILSNEAPDLWSMRTTVAHLIDEESASQPLDVTHKTSDTAAFALDSHAKQLESIQSRLWRFAIIPRSTLRIFGVKSIQLRPSVLLEYAHEEDSIEPKVALAEFNRLQQDRRPEALKEGINFLLKAAYGFAIQLDGIETERAAHDLIAIIDKANDASILPNELKISIKCQAVSLRAWACLVIAQQESKVFKEALILASESVKLSAEAPSKVDRIGLRLAYEVWLRAALLHEDLTEHKHERDLLNQALITARENQTIAAQIELLLAFYDRDDFHDESAKSHLRQAISLQKLARAPVVDLAYSMGMLSDCLCAQGNLAAAEYYVQEALKLYDSAVDVPKNSEVPIALVGTKSIKKLASLSVQKIPNNDNDKEASARKSIPTDEAPMKQCQPSLELILGKGALLSLQGRIFLYQRRYGESLKSFQMSTQILKIEGYSTGIEQREAMIGTIVSLAMAFGAIVNPAAIEILTQDVPGFEKIRNMELLYVAYMNEKHFDRAKEMLSELRNQFSQSDSIAMHEIIDRWFANMERYKLARKGNEIISKVEDWLSRRGMHPSQIGLNLGSRIRPYINKPSHK